ncbi:unnamed protein product [Heligmosomoides polygyrus]|uniref:Uncharacterized protein n=1 Tax=Heligmosomoides polygyrus TaxID=6339 RepID=A0A183FY27_HELPZ|nr:unnamed protein product [Heligmosomoides polygyrus]
MALGGLVDRVAVGDLELGEVGLDIEVPDFKVPAVVIRIVVGGNVVVPLVESFVGFAAVVFMTIRAGANVAGPEMAVEADLLVFGVVVVGLGSVGLGVNVDGLGKGLGVDTVAVDLVGLGADVAAVGGVVDLGADVIEVDLMDRRVDVVAGGLVGLGVDVVGVVALGASLGGVVVDRRLKAPVAK